MNTKYRIINFALGFLIIFTQVFVPNTVASALTPNVVFLDVKSFTGVIEVQIDQQYATANGVEADLTVKNPLNLWQRFEFTGDPGVVVSGRTPVDDVFSGWKLIPPDAELHFHVVFTSSLSDNLNLTFKESTDLKSATFNLVYILLELVPGVKGTSPSTWTLVLNDINSLISVVGLSGAGQGLIDIVHGNVSLIEIPQKIVSFSSDLWGAFSRVSDETKVASFTNILSKLGTQDAAAKATSLVTKIGNAFTVLSLCKTISDEIILLWFTWETGGISQARLYSAYQAGGLNPPSTSPTPISPSNNVLVNTNRPTLTWSSVPNTTQYIIQLSATPDFKVLNVSYRTPLTSFTLPNDLSGSTIWFWKVLALNEAGLTPYSSSSQFQTPFTSSSNLPVDAATFTGYETVVDGTILVPNTNFVKTWRVKNSGTSTWTGYKLKYVDGEQMNGPAEIALPITAPGETRDISINLKSPGSAGLHSGAWQITNAGGTWVPGGKLWVKIDVQTGNSSIILNTDPPSPSAASRVRLHARVAPFSAFRAMRIKIDGAVVYELGATEFYYDWDTGAYEAGDHSIIVEVADQTDTSWSRPQRLGSVYTLTGNSTPVNHAPNRPTLVANPAYDWYVTIGGSPRLCAQAQGDPDGDAVSQYRFVASASVGTGDSGWGSSSCYTFASLTPGTYEWHAQVKDSRGGISDWSDKWHFTVEPSGITATINSFNPGSASNAEEVKIYACTSGHGGVNITMRVLVNEANDGSDSGRWNIIKEQGSPCFSDNDVPIWRTLSYADGPHRVRVVAWAIQPDAGATYDTVYTLNHRRPDSPGLRAPVPLSLNIREPIYLNSRTVTFKWDPATRATGYVLHVGTNPSPASAPNPVFRQTFNSSTLENTVVFGQDYPTLYWQVQAINDVGSNSSGDQLFGIDRQAPTCTVQAPAPPVYESVFQVNWSGNDNLAGISSFNIQYKDSARDTWEDWLGDVPAAKGYELFNGQPGHTYYFRCQAKDHASNLGVYPDSEDTSVTVDPFSRPETPWWIPAYTQKRGITLLNNMPGMVLPAGYPVHLRFDGNTTPTAAEIYNASASNPKCNDLRIVHNDTTQLHRLVTNCSASRIDIWFRTNISVPAGGSNNNSYQLYYGNPTPDAPLADPNQIWYPYRENDTAYLYYFQEGSGSSASDASGNNRNCSINPSVQWSSGKFGNGLVFNRANGGNSQSLTCGSASLSSFTIDFWIKPNSNGDGRLAGQLASGGRLNWLLSDFEGRMRLDVWPCSSCGSSEIRSNFSLRDPQYVGKWNHVAVSFNGGNEVRFYINGALDSTKYLSQSGLNQNNIPLEIGSVEGMSQINESLGGFRISTGVKTSFPYGSFGNIINEPSTAVGDIVTPPATGSPDLAILNLSTYPNPGGGVLVEALVQNQGNLSTQSGFYTDLYVDHVPAGAGDLSGSLQFWVNNPIDPGQTVPLTTVIQDLSSLPQFAAQKDRALAASGIFSETSAILYAQTDSAGRVEEPDNQNNIYSTGVQVCTARPDAFEEDDTSGTAVLIPLGVSQSHNFDRPGDQDWIRFGAQAGKTYRITTSNLGMASDTGLYLYNTNGTSLVASNDDFNNTLASRIEWTAPQSGTYFVLVKHWNPNTGGCGTGYDIGISEGLPNPPAAFNKSAPANGATDQPTSLTLSWGTSSGATSYEYCYDTTNDHACSTWSGNGTSTSKALGGLSASTTYYWHVRAVNTGGTTYSNGSPTADWSFRTKSSSVISGNAGVSGATLSYTDGIEKAVTSQPDGSYSFQIPPGWSGTVTPTHTCYTFSPANRSYSNLAGNQGAQNYTPTIKAGCADLNVSIRGVNEGRFGVLSPGSARTSLIGIDNGPVKLTSANMIPVMGAERVIYKVNGVNTSYSEMMGLPNGQLDTAYYLPWYNNVDLNTQLRIANVSGSQATITVTIGGAPQPSFNLAAGKSTRLSYTGLNSGPVKISSTQTIVAAERVIYKVSNTNTSFSEMMALPQQQLDQVYYLPWYNNVDLDTQLRIANISGAEATITVTIGSVPQPSFQLAAGKSTRVSYAANNGPVKIASTQNIVAAERVIYKAAGGSNTSFSEMMALPANQLDKIYWLPWYNNVDLDTQLRFGNISSSPATVQVYIAGQLMAGSPFTLQPGQSKRISFAGMNKGPVKIVSNVDIVAAERVIYRVNGIQTSYSEMMGLPNAQLDTSYWLPWYNNVDLDTQLRFGVP